MVLETMALAIMHRDLEIGSLAEMMSRWTDGTWYGVVDESIYVGPDGTIADTTKPYADRVPGTLRVMLMAGSGRAGLRLNWSDIDAAIAAIGARLLGGGAGVGKQ
jgi:hypothetical protein